MEDSKLISLKDVVEYFSVGIDKLIEETARNYEGKILKGYHSFSYQCERSKILSGIKTINAAAQIYAKLLDKQLSTEDLRQFTRFLVGTNHETTYRELKRRYVKSRNISIPNLPFKEDKLIEVYDFNAQVLELIDSIVALANTINGKPELYLQYLKTPSNLFEFSEEDDSILLDRYTVWSSTSEISEAICLEMLCQALTNLKKPGYSFDELPEMDHRLVPMIKVDKLDDSVTFDLGRFLNQDGKNPFIDGLSDSPFGAMQVRVSKNAI
jgi:hypothetical protein